MADKRLINKRPSNYLGVIKNVSSGNNSDSKVEVLGAKEEGEIIECLNGRMSNAKNGKDISRESIGGEVLFVSANTGGNVEFVCIMACSVNRQIVQVWVEKDNADVRDIITIDGVIMSYADWLFKKEYPLQFDVNENAIGGEVYIADDNTIPVYLSIQDIIDSFNNSSQKYFTDFNRSLYEINLYAPTDQIVFKGISEVGFGAGLPVGQYSYSHRYGSTNGDRSAWSVYTPLAFIPENYDFTADALDPFPFQKTTGNQPTPDVFGRYGLKLAVRVNNSYNYEFIEIKVVAYNNGAGIGFVPDSKIIKTIPIGNGQLSVIEYVDGISNRNQNIAISPEEELTSMSIIERAKGIRYIYNKVVLANIKYASRDINNEYSFIESSPGVAENFPFVTDIGLAGHKNDLNHCYKKSLLNGERYGLRVVFWDGNFTKSFGAPIGGLDNVEMPNRRDIVAPSSLSEEHSDGLIYCANVDIQATLSTQKVSNTFEVVDYTDLKKREESVNATSAGNIRRNILNAADDASGYYDTTAQVAGYKPFPPKKPYDYEAHDEVAPVNGAFNEIDDASIITDNGGIYEPYMFRPRYNSLGLGISGLETYPSWAKAFSIVRTKPAGRVVCQGLAFYKFKAGPSPLEQYKQGKFNATFLAHLPDVENAVVPSVIIEDMLNNPQRYKVQMVCPVGFGSEVYNQNAYEQTGSPGDPYLANRIDMAMFARQTVERADGRRVNFGEDSALVGIPIPSGVGVYDGYTTFGSWRNVSPYDNTGEQASPYDTDSGNYEFSVSAIAKNTEEEDGTSLYEITLTENLYKFDYLAGGGFFNGSFPDSRALHEPVYVFNIIQTDAVPSEQDFDTFLQTGCYQKLDAIIGLGTGIAGQVCVMCGERLEDYTNSDNLYDNYLYVVQTNGTEYRWIDVTNKSGGQVTSIDAAIAGATTYTSDVSKQPAVLIYGKYTVDIDNNIVLTDAAELDSEIHIKYDNRFHIKVFGDTFTGTATAPIVTRSLPVGGGAPVSYEILGTEMMTDFPLPYPRWGKNPRNLIVREVSGSAETIETPDKSGYVQGIRQAVAVYECQSRSAIHLAYGDCFPNVGYIQRPWKYDASLAPEAQFLFAEYGVDYPDEVARWIYGGFRTKQFPINIDLSNQPNHDKYVSSSNIYVKEQTEFPTREAWSQTRPIQIYSSPNLKSFRPLNIFDISDNYGEIKKLYSERSSEFQENLYALTEYNICLSMTRKRTIQTDGGTSLTLSSIEDNKFILDQLWVGSKEKGGLHKDYWLTAAESGEALYFANINSVFKFQNNKQIDIASGYSYFKRINDLLLLRNESPSGVYYDRLSAVWDREKREYWISAQFEERAVTITTADTYVFTFGRPSSGIIYPVWTINSNYDTSTIALDNQGNNDVTYYFVVGGNYDLNFIDADTALPLGTFSPGDHVEVTWNEWSQEFSVRKIDSDNLYSRRNFVFSFTDGEKIKGWNGIYDYEYDKFVQQNNSVYGAKSKLITDTLGLATFKLDEGLIINDSSINFNLFASVNPEIVKSVEFIRIRVNSNLKPTKVYFYDGDDILLQVGEIDESKLLNYHGFENYIPKHSVDRVRRQGMFLTYRVKYKDYNKFNISFVSFDYKVIR